METPKRKGLRSLY